MNPNVKRMKVNEVVEQIARFLSLVEYNPTSQNAWMFVDLAKTQALEAIAMCKMTKKEMRLIAEKALARITVKQG